MTMMLADQRVSSSSDMLRFYVRVLDAQLSFLR